MAHAPQFVGFKQTTRKQQTPEAQGEERLVVTASVGAIYVPALAKKPVAPPPTPEKVAYILAQLLLPDWRPTKEFVADGVADN